MKYILLPPTLIIAGLLMVYAVAIYSFYRVVTGERPLR